MTTKIEIEGNIARTIRTEIVAEAHLSSLAPHLVSYVAHGFPTLPRNPVRHIWFDPATSKGYMLVETGPRRHHMRVILGGDHYSHYQDRMEGDATDQQYAQFRVQLPFLYFLYSYTVNVNPDLGGIRIPTNFTIDGSYLFMRPTAYRGPQDVLWPAEVPNVYGDGRICWGYTQTENASLDVRLDDYTNSFWTTFFNQDLGMNTPFGEDVEALAEWETNSEDALAYMSWPMWQQTHLAKTITELKDLVMGGPTEVVMAELNPSFIALPELPQGLTVGAVQQWLERMDPAMRRRFMVGAGLVNEHDTPTTPPTRRRRTAGAHLRPDQEEVPA